MFVPMILEGLTTGVIKELSEDRVILALPGTDYRLHLTLAATDRPALSTCSGNRVQGVIEARSLRLHVASGGGRFIEPVEGEPRIIAGTVLQSDERNYRALVHAGTPIWLTTRPGQDFRAIREGALVNCYVESGARFVPVDS